jgi:hypothetical protein
MSNKIHRSRKISTHLYGNETLVKNENTSTVQAGRMIYSGVRLRTDYDTDENTRKDLGRYSVYGYIEDRGNLT